MTARSKAAPALVGMVTLALLGCSEARRAATDGVAVESVRVTIASGEWRLVGDLVVPRTAGRVPAVVLLNQAAGDRSVYAGLAAALAGRGLASLRIDLRGHGESTNWGRFVPDEGTAILAGTDEDVAAAQTFLRDNGRIDPERIAVVGASYSGEMMMEAGRKNGFAAAYVGLSPGSLSDQSIDAIDAEKLPWLLVVSRHERYLKEVAQAFRDRSRTGEVLELGGTEHATRLLHAHPDLNGRLAEWLHAKLAAGRQAPGG